MTEPKISSEKTTLAAAQDSQIPENQGEDISMKIEKENKLEAEDEEHIISTKKMQLEITKMHDRVYNLEVVSKS